MCKYIIKGNQCSISKENCPYMFFCNKDLVWKPNNYMPNRCKMMDKVEVPEGYCRVREERKGYLYVDINGNTYKVLNPFDAIPLFVKAKITKTGKITLKK